MENLELYHWIAIVIGVVLFLKLFGKSKGGAIVSRVTADLKVLSPQFQSCRPEAKYLTFKEGKPNKIDIEIENLPLQPGEVLDFYINRKLLSRVEVKRDLEAEFEHWSDEGVDFPHINPGDQLDIAYQNTLVLSGVFQLNR